MNGVVLGWTIKKESPEENSNIKFHIKKVTNKKQSGIKRKIVLTIWEIPEFPVTKGNINMVNK